MTPVLEQKRNDFRVSLPSSITGCMLHVIGGRIVRRTAIIRSIEPQHLLDHIHAVTNSVCSSANMVVQRYKDNPCEAICCYLVSNVNMCDENENERVRNVARSLGGRM